MYWKVCKWRSHHKNYTFLMSCFLILFNYPAASFQFAWLEFLFNFTWNYNNNNNNNNNNNKALDETSFIFPHEVIIGYFLIQITQGEKESHKYSISYALNFTWKNYANSNQTHKQVLRVLNIVRKGIFCSSWIMSGCV